MLLFLDVWTRQLHHDLPTVTMDGDAITMTSPSKLGPLGARPDTLSSLVRAGMQFVLPLVIEVCAVVVAVVAIGCTCSAD